MLLEIFVYKFLWGRRFSFLLSVFLGMESQGHKVIKWLTVWRNINLFSKAAVPFCNPPTMHEHCNFSATLMVLVLVFYYTHPRGCEVVSYCHLNLHFCCSVSFHVLIGGFYVFLGRNVYLNHSSFTEKWVESTENCHMYTHSNPISRVSNITDALV